MTRGRSPSRVRSFLSNLRSAIPPAHGRPLALVLAALMIFPAFAIQPADARGRSGQTWERCAPGVLIAGYADALDKATFDGTNIGGLSALAHDDARAAYYALVDNEDGAPARFYTLSIPAPQPDGFAGPTVEAVTLLQRELGVPFTGGNFDGEGMAVTGSGTLLISSETEPSIREFSIDGEMLGEFPIPGRFMIEPTGEGRTNQSLEGLTIAPNGRTVYSANESPLLVDGEGQIRFLRHQVHRPGRVAIAGEYYYQTEPGQSVGEILAISDSELLVLERSYVTDVGNTIRIFLTSTAGATNVPNVESLDGAGIDPLPKQLLVDIVDCPPGDATVGQPQPNPLLDNFEGLALGPVVQGRYRTVYLLSDDNFNPNQVTRVIALAVDESLLEGPTHWPLPRAN